MRKRIFGVLFAFVALMSFSLSADAQADRKSVSAAEVNGTFRMNFTGKYREFSNQIKILALGGSKLRVGMDLVYPLTTGSGEKSVNMGSLDGEASISADTAIYQSAEFGTCKITIKFVKPGAIKVTQEGSDTDCGFGHNVTANGTYRRVSGKKPKFEGAQ